MIDMRIVFHLWFTWSINISRKP